MLVGDEFPVPELRACASGAMLSAGAASLCRRASLLSKAGGNARRGSVIGDLADIWPFGFMYNTLNGIPPMVQPDDKRNILVTY